MFFDYLYKWVVFFEKNLENTVNFLNKSFRKHLTLLIFMNIIKSYLKMKEHKKYGGNRYFWA